MEADECTTEMNFSFPPKSSNCNIQSLINQNLSLHNKANANTLGSFTGEIVIQHAKLIYLAHFILFLASLVGNSVIIHIIRKDNSMKTTTNYLILNQACADLLMTMLDLVFISLLSSPSKNLWFGGLFGLITCKLFAASLYIPAVFSVWILVTIAVERFYAVTQPFRSSPVSQHLRKTILLLWVWSVASSANLLVNGTVGAHEGNNYCYIAETWLKFRFSLGTALNVALPFLIITVLYIIVCYKLWSREIPGEGTSQNQRQIQAFKTAKKVTRMMIAIVVLYVLYWFPMDIYFLLNFGGYGGINITIYFFLNWLTAAYSGLNPFIYLACNESLRNRFRDFFGHCLKKITIGQVVLPSRSRSVELEQI